jgi:nucleoside-diphosphate-sugar epimerase
MTRAVIDGDGNVGSACLRRGIELGIQCDRSPRDLDRLDCAQRPDYLFLCAGPTGDFRTRVLDTFDAAVSRTIRLLRALNPRRVIAVSSVRIYGFRAEPDEFSEADSAHTDHRTLDFAYDGAKQALENIVMFGAKECASEGVIARLSNVVGGEMRPQRAAMLHHAMRQARDRGEMLETRQHLSSSKDYVHIDDVAEGLWLAASKAHAGEAYNLASGVALSVSELALAMGVRMLCSDPNARPQHSRISIRKAAKDLGFQPRYDTTTAIAEAMAN